MTNKTKQRRLTVLDAPTFYDIDQAYAWAAGLTATYFAWQGLLSLLLHRSVRHVLNVLAATLIALTLSVPVALRKTNAHEN